MLPDLNCDSANCDSVNVEIMCLTLISIVRYLCYRLHDCVLLINELLQWVIFVDKKAFLRFCFGAVWLRFSYLIAALKTFLI